MGKKEIMITVIAACFILVCAVMLPYTMFYAGQHVGQSLEGMGNFQKADQKDTGTISLYLVDEQYRAGGELAPWVDTDKAEKVNEIKYVTLVTDKGERFVVMEVPDELEGMAGIRLPFYKKRLPID